ncbi:MAG TPA: VOC family protein [Solirubrobacterales bacterium]
MRMVFPNLPVKDLQRSRDFFTALGFEFNEQFSDENAACLVLTDNVFVMLLTEQRFRDFIKGEVADAHATTEVTLGISAESRQEVDELYDKALAAGGSEWTPTLEEGPMYQRSFQDPDGHVWEVIHMDLG